MVVKFARNLAIFILFLAIIYFYHPTLISFLNSKSILPIPADTIVGLYHPYRDFYSGNYPNGIPFKNFLITDPVRQIYPWKELTIDTFKKLQIPTWNPYEMTGKPLSANFQAGSFYPLNILFLLGSFEVMWSIFIILQTFLCAILFSLYLRNLKINSIANAIGTSAYTFSSFNTNWLEWGNLVHTALWLPLILLSIDKILTSNGFYKIKIKLSKKVFWSFIYIFSVTSSFLAGHLQIFFYVFTITGIYFTFRLFSIKKDGWRIKALNFIVLNFIVFLLTIFQWLPTFNFIINSARIGDQSLFTSDGWFMPYQHLVQFLIPDFFGNPSTLNYWGVWNYGELTGYIGIIPFLLIGYSLFFKNKIVFFYLTISLISLLLVLPNFVSKIPYQINIPFLSTAQPTRLLFLIVFSFSVLSAYGTDNLLKMNKIKIKTVLPILLIFFIICSVWITTKLSPEIYITDINRVVAQRNLILPSALFIGGSIAILLYLLVRNKSIKVLLLYFIFLITVFDLVRFSQKFNSFSKSEYIFPNTNVINFLKSDKDYFRVAVTDRRIMPPNFFTHYKISTIEGYDPLYLKSYAEFVAALERNKPDVKEPFGFNRIIAPHNINSPLMDFLNVKYVLTFDNLDEPKFTEVFREGSTKVFKNNFVLPRVYFVEKLISSSNVFEELFKNDLKNTAVIYNKLNVQKNYTVGTASISNYNENYINIITNNSGEGFLVMSDAFYPTWEVFIDGRKDKILKVNNAFRGVIVPKGSHKILFKNKLI